MGVNHFFDRTAWLIVGMNYYYATLHFVVTIGVLIWLYVRRPERYRSARTALYAARSSRWRALCSWPPHRRGS